MTDTQRAEFDSLTAEINRLSELFQSIAHGANNTMTSQEVFDLFNEATAALRAFVESMGEYHGFQAQLEAFQNGTASADNWFVQAQANFELSSAEIAEEIAEIRLNFHNQLNLSGMGGFHSIFEQLSLANANNTMMQWLVQLPVFGGGN